jgi:hypothetical protein
MNRMPIASLWGSEKSSLQDTRLAVALQASADSYQAGLQVVCVFEGM